MSASVPISIYSIAMVMFSPYQYSIYISHIEKGSITVYDVRVVAAD
jgi:hypothetical protein